MLQVEEVHPGKRYQKGKFLSMSNFSTVAHALDSTDGQMVAIKRIKVSR